MESNPLKQYQSKPTRAMAIKAMCAHCMGCTSEHIEQGFKQSIRDCDSTHCPLHRFRPYRANRGANKAKNAHLQVSTHDGAASDE